MKNASVTNHNISDLKIIRIQVVLQNISACGESNYITK